MRNLKNTRECRHRRVLRIRRPVMFGWLLPMLVSPALMLAHPADIGAQQITLPLFWKSRLSDVEAGVKEVKKGEVRVLARSAGGRDIYLVSYGQKPSWHSTANYNSAAAGQDPSSYARKDG